MLIDTFTVFRIRNFHNFFDLYILESYKLPSNGPFNIGWLLIFSQVEFEITVPLAVKDKVTEDDIKESMKNILEEMPTVGDVTMDANTLTVLGEYQCITFLVN